MKNSNGSKTKLKESLNDRENSFRQRAEAQAASTPVNVSELTAEQIEEVVQELNVHQIELSLQNEELRRLTQELEKSRDAYIELYDFAPVGYFTLASDYRILEVNLTGCNMLGLKRQSLVNTLFTRFLETAYADTFYLCLKKAEKSAALIACECQLHKINGKVFFASARIGWTPEVDGERLCRLVIMDVTEQKKAGTALKESEERFREIADALSEGIFETDKSGTLTYANRRLLALLGSSEEEVKKGLSLFDIFSPAYVDTARSRFERVLLGEDAGVHEYLIKKGDGAEFPALVHSLVRKNAEVQGIRGILVDITSQKKAEDALKESEERYRNLFESMVEGFAYCQMIFHNRMPVDWVYVDVNPAFERITGLKNAKGENVTKLIPEIQKTNPELFKIYGRVATGGPPENFESYIPELGIWFSVSAYSPKTGYFVAVFQDITARKKTEAEIKDYSVKLEESNGQLQQFVFAVSHDLKEPLRMMTSFSQSLEKYMKGKMDARAKEFVEFIVSGAARMQRLLDDLVVFSRVVTQALPFQQVDMEVVFRDVITNLKVSIEETGATITHEKLPPIEADPAQMAQVLQNLISNGIKFHRRGERPVVHVSCKKDSEWMFAVKDNGIGIPQELFGRLFVIFSRLNPQEEYPGTGMGLAITKRIVQRHGGRVWVESEPGKGSTFYFTVAINNTEKETGSQEKILP